MGGLFFGKGRSIVIMTSKPVFGFDKGDDSVECSRCLYYTLVYTQMNRVVCCRIAGAFERYSRTRKLQTKAIEP